MSRTRIGLVGAGMLAGSLLLGTAGLALADAPPATPTPSPTWTMPGGGMMNGQNGGGMMNGQNGGGMMNGQNGGGMMNGQNGHCDPDLMQSMHDQYHPDAP